jgi:V8-like Glu-specific endopeptidase
MRDMAMKAALIVSASWMTVPADANADDTFTCWAPTTAQLIFATDYWTPDRMKRARPDGETIERATSPKSKNDQLTSGDAERAPVDQAPYKYGGKLFYTRGGDDYEASAQFFVEDNILIGAAHSLWKDGNQATNIAFFQGYSGGGGTRYDIDKAAVLTHWTEIAGSPVSLGKSQFDYAAMRTTKPSAVGKYLAGSAAVDDTATITGYPGRLEQGAYMYEEEARIVVSVGSAFEAQPHPMYGGGASGGAWFVAAKDAGKAVAVVSAGDDEGVYGASFTDVTTAMVAYVKGGCQ